MARDPTRARPAPGGRRRRRRSSSPSCRRGRVPHYLGDGRVEQTRRRCLDSVLRRPSRGRTWRPARRRRAVNQGEPCSRDCSDQTPPRPRFVWQDSRAQRPCATRFGRPPRPRRRALIRPGRSTLLQRARRWRWIRRNLTRDGVVTTTDAWLLHALHRRAGHRRRPPPADRSCSTSTRSRWSPELARRPRPRGGGAAASRRARRTGRHDERLRRRRTGGGPARRPAGGAAGAGLPLRRRDQVRIRHRRVPASLRDPGRRSSGSGLTTSGRRRLRERRTASTGGSTPLHRRRCSSTSACSPPRHGRRGRRGRWRRPVSSRALAGLAAPWWRSDATATFAGPLSRPRALTSSPQCCAVSPRRSVDLLGRGRRPIRAPVTRLRVDGGTHPLAHAHAAGAGRPPQVPVDRLPVRGRATRVQCARPPPWSGSTATRGSPTTSSAGGQPSATSRAAVVRLTVPPSTWPAERSAVARSARGAS